MIKKKISSFFPFLYPTYGHIHDHIFNQTFLWFCTTVRRLGWSSTALLHMTATGNWPMQRQRRQSHGHVVILVKETSQQRGGRMKVGSIGNLSARPSIFSFLLFSSVIFRSVLACPGRLVYMLSLRA